MEAETFLDKIRSFKMTVQIIEFDEFGMMSGLVHKKGVNLTKLGQPTKTTRYSEILFTSDDVEDLEHLDGSQVVIRILQGYGKGKLLTAQLYERIVGEVPKHDGVVSSYYIGDEEYGYDVMLFDDYDRAVTFEVKFSNALTLKGFK